MRTPDSSDKDAYIDTTIDRMERKNEHLQQRLDAWLGTLDEVGLAVARLDNVDTGGFLLNAAAQQDLHMTEPHTAKAVIDEGVRDLLWSDATVIVWRPAAQVDATELDSLTRREREVFDWLQQGKSLEETAIILGISPRTVEKHRSNLYRKLNDAKEGGS